MSIPIIFACDNNYAPPTAVAITSLIANKAPGTRHDIHILANALSDFHAQRLASLAAPGVSITIRDVPDRPRDIPANGPVTTTTLYRFIIPELFPRHDTALYLDGDIIILSDLAPLLNLDLAGRHAAAALQVNIGDFPPYSFQARPKEFNAGILLLNLRRMREENLYPRLMEAVVRNNIGANDQVALNQVFNGDIHWIDTAYNYASSYDFLCTDREAARHFNTTPAEWRRVQKNPAIVHYIDSKPWLDRCSLRSKLWRRYYKMSPYRDVKLQYRATLKPLATSLLAVLLPMFLRPVVRGFYARFVKG